MIWQGIRINGAKLIVLYCIASNYDNYLQDLQTHFSMVIKYAKDLSADSVNQIERVALVGVSDQNASDHSIVVSY